MVIWILPKHVEISNQKQTFPDLGFFTGLLADESFHIVYGLMRSPMASKGPLGTIGFGTRELWDHGGLGTLALGPWDFGTMRLWDHWLWDHRVLGPWDFGPKRLWPLGTLAPWEFSSLGHWPHGTLDLWDFGHMGLWSHETLVP